MKKDGKSRFEGLLENFRTLTVNFMRRKNGQVSKFKYFLTTQKKSNQNFEKAFSFFITYLDKP